MGINPVTIIFNATKDNFLYNLFLPETVEVVAMVTQVGVLCV